MKVLLDNLVNELELADCQLWLGIRFDGMLGGVGEDARRADKLRIIGHLE